MASLHSPLSTFRTGTYAVTRRVASTYAVNGDLVPGASSSFDIEAVVEPLGGRKLEQLAPAQVGKENVLILTATEIRTRQVAKTGVEAAEPDRIRIGDEDWDVIQSARREFRGAVHYEAIASLVIA